MSYLLSKKKKMRIKKYRISLSVIIATFCFVACSKKWNDHNQIVDPAIANNLYQVISKNNNLSKFNSLLIKSGYDKIIATSKSFTVWAPSDLALTTLDTAIINDPVKLKAFVGNHIANLSYPAGSTNHRVPMLNGKYILFS